MREITKAVLITKVKCPLRPPVVGPLIVGQLFVEGTSVQGSGTRGRWPDDLGQGEAVQLEWRMMKLELILDC